MSWQRPVPKRTQKIVIFDGPDRCGKTNIAQALSHKLSIPYFKFSNEAKHWKENSFKETLVYGEPKFVQFLRDTRTNVILDRDYPSEWVYSQVFERDTDMELLRWCDEEFARMGAYIVIPLRHRYEGNIPNDELVPKDKFLDLHNKYVEFTSWTKCSTVIIFVDAFGNKIGPQLDALCPELEFDDSLFVATNVVLDQPKPSEKDVSDLFSEETNERKVTIK